MEHNFSSFVRKDSESNRLLLGTSLNGGLGDLSGTRLVRLGN